MQLKKTINFVSVILSLTIFTTHADPVIINNNMYPNEQSSNQPQYNAPCPPANQNNIYDPRIPPAGVYRTEEGTTYTTGQKAPYIIDNNCNTGSIIQPYVYSGSGPNPWQNSRKNRGNAHNAAPQRPLGSGTR